MVGRLQAKYWGNLFLGWKKKLLGEETFKVAGLKSGLLLSYSPLVKYLNSGYLSFKTTFEYRKKLNTLPESTLDAKQTQGLHDYFGDSEE